MPNEFTRYYQFESDREANTILALAKDNPSLILACIHLAENKSNLEKNDLLFFAETLIQGFTVDVQDWTNLGLAILQLIEDKKLVLETF